MSMTPRRPLGRPDEETPETGPSLLDDLFADPGKKSRYETKRRAKEDLSHPPSLAQEVFGETQEQIRRHVPVWWIVLGAVALTAVGSLIFYRSNQAPPPVWKEDPKPKLEMATPPPVPPLPGEADAKTAEKQPHLEESKKPAPLAQKETPAPLPVQPRPTPKPPEAAKVVKPPLAEPVEKQPENKPKLLREPEDLAREQKAFDLLREKSQAATRLLEGALEQYRFLQYEVIPRDAGQYWVDLIAAPKGTDQAVHFVWAVNLDKQTAKALSQAARDIDR